MVCGIVYNVGLFGKYVIEKFVNILVIIDIVLEFRYSDLFVDENLLVILVS